MNVYVEKEDIHLIGNTAYEGENGCLEIICSGETANMEKILPRSILRCWGDFHIVKEEDFPWTDTKIDILYVTDMPWDLYLLTNNNSNNEILYI